MVVPVEAISHSVMKREETVMEVEKQTKKKLVGTCFPVQLLPAGRVVPGTVRVVAILTMATLRACLYLPLSNAVAVRPSVRHVALKERLVVVVVVRSGRVLRLAVPYNSSHHRQRSTTGRSGSGCLCVGYEERVTHSRIAGCCCWLVLVQGFKSGAAAA